MEVANIFAKRVKQRLAELGLTQKAFAKKLGIAQPNIARTLSQGSIPQASNLLSWAMALETTPQWLLGTDTETHKPPPPREPNDIDVVLFMLKGMRLEPDRRRVIELALVADDIALTQALAIFSPATDNKAQRHNR